MYLTKLFRYIFKQALIGVMIAMVCVGMTIVLIDLVEQMRAISGVPNTGVGTALKFTMMRLPGLIEQSIPITILIGTIICFTSLSRRSEISAMRAAGVSAWGFLAPLCWLSGLLGVFIVLGIGPTSARLNENYENEKARLTQSIETQGPGTSSINWRTIATQTGQIVISSEKSDSKNKFKNAVIFEFDKSGTELIRRIAAIEIISNPTNIIAHNATIARTGLAAVILPVVKIDFADEAQSIQSKDPRTVPLWELPKLAHLAEISGGTPERFWLRFFRLIGLPLTMLAMAMFAAEMSLGLERAGSKAKSVVIALALGLMMYFFGDVAALMAISGRIPASVAGLAPPIFVLAMTLAFVSLREDGGHSLS